MLKRPPTNLNRQAEEATILLIREVLARNIKLSHVYVDALGSTVTYQQYLSKQFPGIEFTVTAKADSKFKIVGAASVAAKVTRDAWITGWEYDECHGNNDVQKTWSDELGSGYPSGELAQMNPPPLRH